MKNNIDSASNKFIELKTGAEIEIMRQAGQITAKILNKLVESTKPDMSTKALEEIARREMNSFKVKPAFLGYRGFPASTCISINNELVHGIPSASRKIKKGDIVSIDLGVLYKGFYGDAAVTFGVGEIAQSTAKLLEVTKTCLDKAIEKSKPGNRLGDVAWAVQSHAESFGFSVVRDYVGHGIGRKLHEEPQILNFGRPNTGTRLVPGMVFCIEPMINEGSFEVETLKDKWTVVTKDGKLCAHFEHMVAVTENGCDVLTKI
jgi:methionyl aminopeptidase